MEQLAFASWLYERRKAQPGRLTQQRLAELVGLSREYVNNLERGRTVPTFETASRIAAVVDPGLDPQQLLGLLVKPDTDAAQTEAETQLLRSFRNRDVNACLRIIRLIAA